EAVALAARLDTAIAAEQDIVIEPQGGLEIAMRGMLIAAGVRNVPSSAASRREFEEVGEVREVVKAADGGKAGLALTLFKALQLLHAKDLETVLERYVTFDFETTDNDVATCGVVEIGAARVVKGEIVDRFHTLVQPYQPISSRASAIHGYTDGDVRDAPSFAQVWPEFRAFVGDDVLIAHNGQHFDIPVLRRLAAGLAGMDSLAFYDTLPLARSLSRDSAKLEDLALRFGIDAGRAHHAVDDAIERLGGHALMTRLRAEPDPAQRYPAAVARLRALIDEPSPPDPLSTKRRRGTLEESIDRLLERVALSTSEGVEVAPDRVNLLTLHSTKGLEFSRVYIVGVEDYQIPGYRESTEKRQAEIEEARRLLYVGMTRA